MSGENKVILNVNGYECWMCHGMTNHKTYLVNDCLNEYTMGRYGLLRVLTIGIWSEFHFRVWDIYCILH